jgi:hypothetical protein
VCVMISGYGKCHYIFAVTSLTLYTCMIFK